MDIEELRLTYDLNKDSVVIDIGSYIGQFSQKIYNRYKCRVFAFEPVNEYFVGSRNKLLKGLPVKVYNYGIGPESSKTTICKSGDTSSMLNHTGNQEEITVKTIEEAMAEIGITGADLVKINIEGIEYPLLDKWHKNGILTKFRDLQIQFHRTPGWENQIGDIRTKLAQTHVITYNHDMIWENWRRK